jgi:hypothetical protein
MTHQDPDSIHSSKAADIISKVVRVAAYPLAAVTTYFAGDVYLRNSIYKNFAKHGFFDKRKRACDLSDPALQDQVHLEIRQQVEEAYKGGIIKSSGAQRERLVGNAAKFNVLEEPKLKKLVNDDELVERALDAASKSFTQRLEKSASSGALTDRVSGIYNAYRQEVRQFFEDVGIRNIRDYAKVTHRNQKVEAAAFALTSGAVMLGAALTLANSQGLLDLLSKKEKPAEASRA